MKKFLFTFLAFCAAWHPVHSQDALFPENHLDLKHPITYQEMTAFLEKVESFKHIEITREGTSVENRDLFLVHLNRGEMQSSWRILLYGAQHGDEPAGKDALLYLIRYLADNPRQLPPDVDLWIMPMVNPDGVARNQRRNGNGADLNRDHTLLSQPETQALHRVFRLVMPHVAVDCHEFRRDSPGYHERGWLEWPKIKMDTANHPLFDETVYQHGLSWIDHMSGVLEAAGHNFSRYVVGDAPPEGELRYSTLDTDDGRNGLGAYGRLSFIIESGVRRSADDPNADLGLRVDAYLRIFHELMRSHEHRGKDLENLATLRAKYEVPKFLPVNYF